METPAIVLASASPRRRRLLAWLGAPYETTATDTAEDLTGPLRRLPPVLARSLAADKARAARDTHDSTSLIVAFDTIVVLEGDILGKPVDIEDAWRMLRMLSGRTHQVITGVARFAPSDEEPTTFAVTTDVQMRELDGEAIAAWLEEGEAMGCAGAYNIERMLASVGPDECYQNVAGLPLCHLYAHLARTGLTGLAVPVETCDAARGSRCGLGPRVCGGSGIASI